MVTSLNFIHVGGEDRAEFKLCLVNIRLLQLQKNDFYLELELTSVEPRLTGNQKGLDNK